MINTVYHFPSANLLHKTDTHLQPVCSHITRRPTKLLHLHLQHMPWRKIGFCDPIPLCGLSWSSGRHNILFSYDAWCSCQWVYELTEQQVVVH